MSKYFHKLDKATKNYLLYKRKAMGVLIIFVGLIWAMEMMGWLNIIPMHEYFMPGFLVVAGIFELIRAFQLK